MRIAIVGLGSIAEHHVAALEELPDAQLIAGVDIEPGKKLTFRGAPVATFSTLAELFTREHIDSAIVTTPTASHAAAIDEIARCSPCRILVEKPLAANLPDVQRFLADDYPNDVQTLFHAAAAPEVNWARDAFGDMVGRHGDLVAIDMFLADGGLQEIVKRRRSLSDAWIDLGINALSVAARFVSLEKVELAHRDRPSETYQARIRFGDGDAAGYGSVLVTWAGLEASKHSLLCFRDGARLLLDHHAGAAVLTVGGAIETLFILDDARPRLRWHYRNLFEMVLDGHRLFDRNAEIDLHEKLFEI